MTYPVVLTLEQVESIQEVTHWINNCNLDCKWYTFLFIDLSFCLGYDFFFKIPKDAVLFKLTWGGYESKDLPPFSGFFMNS